MTWIAEEEKMTVLEYFERRQAMNKEGYRDPTAEQAISNASKVPKYIKEIFRALNTVAGIHSLEITEMRDIKTGRVYRR